MSHLREPAARAERREGGRHGRPGPRAVKELPEARIRRQLLRASVLPAVAVALAGAAAVLCVVQVTGARPTPLLWGLLAAAATVAVAGIAAAVVAADRTTRAVMDRVSALRRTTARGQNDLRALVERLRRGEAAPRPTTTPPGPAAGPGADEFDQLARELTRAQESAVASVVQAAQLSSQASSEQKVELLVNLARRLQSLVHREIQLLDELENEVEDPELLKGLFHVDHLATRIRRHAENLAVLGGAISRRQWSHPVTMSEVLRSAIAEVEQYSRVKLVPPIDGTLRGHAVADVIHLLAELVENASVFSPPHTQVLMRASRVTSGLAIEVEDRGLGMAGEEQSEMNALLADPEGVDVAGLIAGGRIGLFVVAALARRHGIAVRLQTNIYGGVQAVIVLPQSLLGADDETAADGQQPQTPTDGRQAQAAGEGRHQQAAADGRQQQTAAQPGPQAVSRTGPQQVVRTGPQPVVREGGPRPDPQPARTSPAAQPTTAQQAQKSQQAEQAQQAQQAQQGQNSGQFTATGGPLPVPHQATSAAHPAAPAPAEPVRLPRRGADAPALTLHTATHTPVAQVPTQSAPQPQDDATVGRPAPPLPVRGAHASRPNPADASLKPPLPASPAPTGVRGTMGRPQLPKRRAQEHLVPQLRDAPASHAPADEPETDGHDPGLMAAFQRGIGLAEAHGDPRPEPGAHPTPVPLRPAAPHAHQDGAHDGGGEPTG
ncbi:sensor histidine kinase [Streptomyces luteolus]|uniref:histidine kinase n=1 Tax=Streptomyces luteolus TaxID=3043615 RepID=A0ABT6T4Q6_9ACTN|nr:ATP-binding protein [Streptomyces sp. B-S-A12]MDI3422819.1 ATP-binding protein [Streptomyces sp. B-S-A12]